MVIWQVKPHKLFEETGRFLLYIGREGDPREVNQEPSDHVPQGKATHTWSMGLPVVLQEGCTPVLLSLRWRSD
jgi:hypothetical protein